MFLLSRFFGNIVNVLCFCGQIQGLVDELPLDFKLPVFIAVVDCLAWRSRRLMRVPFNGFDLYWCVKFSCFRTGFEFGFFFFVIRDVFLFLCTIEFSSHVLWTDLSCRKNVSARSINHQQPIASLAQHLFLFVIWVWWDVWPYTSSAGVFETNPQFSWTWNQRICCSQSRKIPWRKISKEIKYLIFPSTCSSFIEWVPETSKAIR